MESESTIPKPVWPEVPIRYMFTGDTTKGVRLRGMGDSQYYKLRRDMAYQELNTGHNTIRFEDGTYIKTSVIFGRPTIKIHVPLEEGKDVENIEEQKCFCSRCFSLGIIEEVSEMSADNYMSGLRYTYNLFVCKGQSFYHYISGFKARSCNVDRYRVGQFVLVTAGDVSLYSPPPESDICCSGKACMMDKSFISRLPDLGGPDNESEGLVISPMNLYPKMEKWLIQPS